MRMQCVNKHTRTAAIYGATYRVVIILRLHLFGHVIKRKPERAANGTGEEKDMDTASYIKQEKVIAILRGLSLDEGICVVESLKQAGIRFAEVTFQPEKPLDVTTSIIQALCEIYPDMMIGAGTVLSVRQVEAAKRAGARYIISPNFDPEVVAKTKECGMVSIPGAYSPTEVLAAYRAGADIVKLFPADTLGCGYIKAVRSVYTQVPLAAVGGVKTDNVAAFLQAGACCVGAGSSLTPKDAVLRGDYKAIEAIARTFIKEVKRVGAEEKPKLAG